MKNQILSSFALTMLVSFILYSCTKQDTPIGPTVPPLLVNSVSSITSNGASFTCRISINGNSPITSVGVCWGIAPMPTIDSNKITAILRSDSSFTGILSGLNSGTVYYLRAFAVNSVGIGYSSQIPFKTLGGLPQATTDMAIIKPGDTVLLVGKVNPNDLLTTVSFDYGTTVSYGSATSVLQEPFSNGANVEVTTKITGLLRNTIYHYRVKAENEKGISYGEDRTFNVPAPEGTVGTLTDIEGNIYKSIVIGSQVWMAENLKTTRFNDGTAIPNVTDIVQWSVLTTPAYSWYGNNKNLYNGIVYGALYNWFAANTEKLAPVGWHVPSEAEWKVLINYLGAESGGGKMKEEGLTHWMWPNTGATNSSGFTALPSGLLLEGGFTDMGDKACWWTATSSPTPEYAFYHYLDRNNSIDTYNIVNHKFKGFSVRCIKD